MELYPLTRLEARRSIDPQTRTNEVRGGQMEKDRKIKVSLRKIYRSDLHADPKIIRPAIPRRFHGPTPKPLKSIPRQHEKNRRDPKEQLHNKHKQQPHQIITKTSDLIKSNKIRLNKVVSQGYQVTTVEDGRLSDA